MGRKVFSIITPTYNCGDKIEKTITSVLTQKRNLFEYIIVDGGSVDNTIDIIRKYRHEIKWVSQKDKGIYDAMNKGIDMASGKYLYFLGAGDRLRANVLEKVAKLLPRNNEKKMFFVYGDVYRMDTGKAYNGKYNKFKICISNICHQAIFYDRDIFKINGYYDLKYKVLADYAFNIKIFGNGTIQKKYIDCVVADYEGFGVSSKQQDVAFMVDRPRLIRDNLGSLYYMYFKTRTTLGFWKRRWKLQRVR